jgi:hypothetical protein
MRDIWGVPPGLEAGQKVKRNRPGWKPIVAVVVIIMVGAGGGLVFSSMNDSTRVSADQALAEFRATKKTSDSNEASSTDKSKSRTQKASRSKSRSGPDRTKVASTSKGQPVAAAQQDSAATSKNSGTKASSKTVSNSTVGRPEEGVYSWKVEGYEQAPGVRRDIPSRSSRVITYEGDSDWVEHHIFSKEKELWFGLGMSREGVYTTRARNYVKMGPVEIDRTVEFDPPVFVSRFPLELGQTWDGSWTGKTSGEYTAKTFEHGKLTIGGETVEVFGTEVVMNMEGEVSGTVITRSWVAPELRLVVKQYQKSDVKSGPGEYFSEWSGQLTSLHPKT